MRAAVIVLALLLCTPASAQQRLSAEACENPNALGQEFGYSVQLMFFNSFFPVAVQSQACAERVTIEDVRAAIMASVAEAGCAPTTAGYRGFEAVITEWLASVDLDTAKVEDLPPPLVSDSPNFCASPLVTSLARCEADPQCLAGIGE